MTLKITSLGVAMALGLAASASVAEKAPVPLKPSVACDVRLNVVDKDPKGLNVRATPEVRSDNIRTVIPAADWIRVHVVGMAGDWYQIDHYEVFPDNNDEDSEHDLPGGRRDWVHKSKLGDVRAMHGSMMYAAPSDRGKPIYTFADETDVTVLGCQGAFLKIQYKSDGRLDAGHLHQRTDHLRLKRDSRPRRSCVRNPARASCRPNVRWWLRRRCRGGRPADSSSAARPRRATRRRRALSAPRPA